MMFMIFLFVIKMVKISDCSCFLTFKLACEASVSVLFWSKGHAKNGASKRGGGGEERKEPKQTRESLRPKTIELSLNKM